MGYGMFKLMKFFDRFQGIESKIINEDKFKRFWKFYFGIFLPIIIFLIIVAIKIN